MKHCLPTTSVRGMAVVTHPAFVLQLPASPAPVHWPTLGSLMATLQWPQGTPQCSPQPQPGPRPSQTTTLGYTLGLALGTTLWPALGATACHVQYITTDTLVHTKFFHWFCPGGSPDCHSQLAPGMPLKQVWASILPQNVSLDVRHITAPPNSLVVRVLEVQFPPGVWGCGGRLSRALLPTERRMGFLLGQG